MNLKAFCLFNITRTQVHIVSFVGGFHGKSQTEKEKRLQGSVGSQQQPIEAVTKVCFLKLYEWPYHFDPSAKYLRDCWLGIFILPAKCKSFTTQDGSALTKVCATKNALPNEIKGCAFCHTRKRSKTFESGRCYPLCRATQIAL